jgi:signal transduction histidine kinase
MYVIIFLIIVIVLLLKRDTVFVHKLWKYLLLGCSLIFYTIQKSLFKLRKNKSNRQSTSMSQKEMDLEDRVKDIKYRFKDVDMEARIEIRALNTNNEQLREQLKEAKKIEDKEERRERLSSLMSNI